VAGCPDTCPFLKARADDLLHRAVTRRWQCAVGAPPIRDEPIKNRGQSGTLKQFIIAFMFSYLIGYLMNLTLI